MCIRDSSTAHAIAPYASPVPHGGARAYLIRYAPTPYPVLTKRMVLSAYTTCGTELAYGATRG
eukprot:3768847-Rhodomonas_salina.1